MENNFKYIVYETTCLVNNKIYIGVHQTTTPYDFDSYLGCGVIATQPYTYEHAKTAFQCAVKKYGVDKFIRKTLAVFNDEESAYLLEAQLVNEEFLKRDDVYNMVLGGIGGCLKSARTPVYQYDLTGKFIAEYESFAQAAVNVNCDYTLISYAVRYKRSGKNYFWSLEKTDLLDINDFNYGDPQKKPIYVYSKNGEYLTEYNSIQTAVNALKTNRSSIKESCLTFSLLHSGVYCLYTKASQYDIAKTEYIKSRKVYKYSSVGKFICEYNTQSDAEKANKGSNITKAIRLKTKCENNFFWGVEKLEYYNKPKAKKSVGKYSLSGKLIKMYDSASAAEKENGSSVWKALKDPTRTHKNCYYKYIES